MAEDATQVDIFLEGFFVGALVARKDSSIATQLEGEMLIALRDAFGEQRCLDAAKRIDDKAREILHAK